MSENEIKRQIALNEELAKSECEDTARAARWAVQHWENKLTNLILSRGYF